MAAMPFIGNAYLNENKTITRRIYINGRRAAQIMLIPADDDLWHCLHGTLPTRLASGNFVRSSSAQNRYAMRIFFSETD